MFVNFQKMSDTLVPPHMVNKVLSSEPNNITQTTSNKLPHSSGFSRPFDKNTNKPPFNHQTIDSRRGETTSTREKSGWNANSRKPLFSEIQQTFSNDNYQQSTSKFNFKCICNLYINRLPVVGVSWSYGSWIYNYLCNWCLSPLTLSVLTLFMARCTRYNIMW